MSEIAEGIPPFAFPSNANVDTPAVEVRPLTEEDILAIAPQSEQSRAILRIFWESYKRDPNAPVNTTDLNDGLVALGYKVKNIAAARKAVMNHLDGSPSIPWRIIPATFKNGRQVRDGDYILTPCQEQQGTPPKVPWRDIPLNTHERELQLQLSRGSWLETTDSSDDPHVLRHMAARTQIEDGFIVADKPAGIPTVATNNDAMGIAAAVKIKYGTNAVPVHMPDEASSGFVICATDEATYTILRNAVENNGVFYELVVRAQVNDPLAFSSFEPRTAAPWQAVVATQTESGLAYRTKPYQLLTPEERDNQTVLVLHPETRGTQRDEPVFYIQTRVASMELLVGILQQVGIDVKAMHLHRMRFDPPVKDRNETIEAISPLHRPKWVPRSVR